ncbi:hypothetical protein [Sphingobium sp. CFD-2]|uniref:hypothetical protein n=1 Tax=Sphingobium sp. CFD-2 TaxID=2878542 RepID=UPI00214C2CAC|nr:hypothetical protein [Sphingobium sp. CFD-2]
MAEPKHPFRDDLDDQSVLHSTVTRKPIVGRDRILRTIQAAGASYDHMRPTYHEAIGNRSFAEYDARIAGGRNFTAWRRSPGRNRARWRPLPSRG